MMKLNNHTIGKIAERAMIVLFCIYVISDLWIILLLIWIYQSLFN